MDPNSKHEIGKTGVMVSRLGLGARGIVDPAVTVTDEQGVAAVKAYLDGGGAYIDTSARYGNGRSERLVGRALADVDRDSYVLSTKVGRLLDPDAKGGWFWDMTKEGVRRSLRESLARLDLERVDMLYIHSPERHYDEAMAGAYPALAEMRENGVVGAIGVGVTHWDSALKFAKTGGFDCVLLASRYTLLEQSALPEFMAYCLENTISVVIGGPYNTGILASELGPDALYDYRMAPPEVLERARAIRGVCQGYDVPLKAAALQFVLAHPAVASTIPGSSYAWHVEENAAMVARPIPAALWDDLRNQGLVDRDAPVPGEG